MSQRDAKGKRRADLPSREEIEAVLDAEYRRHVTGRLPLTEEEAEEIMANVRKRPRITAPLRRPQNARDIVETAASLINGYNVKLLPTAVTVLEMRKALWPMDGCSRPGLRIHRIDNIDQDILQWFRMNIMPFAFVGPSAIPPDHPRITDVELVNLEANQKHARFGHDTKISLLAIALKIGSNYVLIVPFEKMRWFFDAFRARVVPPANLTWRSPEWRDLAAYQMRGLGVEESQVFRKVAYKTLQDFFRHGTRDQLKITKEYLIQKHGLNCQSCKRPFPKNGLSVDHSRVQFEDVLDSFMERNKWARFSTRKGEQQMDLIFDIEALDPRNEKTKFQLRQMVERNETPSSGDYIVVDSLSGLNELEKQHAVLKWVMYEGLGGCLHFRPRFVENFQIRRNGYMVWGPGELMDIMDVLEQWPRFHEQEMCQGYMLLCGPCNSLATKEKKRKQRTWFVGGKMCPYARYPTFPLYEFWLYRGWDDLYTVKGGMYQQDHQYHPPGLDP